MVLTPRYDSLYPRAGSPPRQNRPRSAPSSQKASPRGPATARENSSARFLRAVAEDWSRTYDYDMPEVWGTSERAEKLHDIYLPMDQANRRVRPLASRRSVMPSNASGAGSFHVSTPRSVLLSTPRSIGSASSASMLAGAYVTCEGQIPTPEGLTAKIAVGTPSGLVARWHPVNIDLGPDCCLVSYEMEVELFGAPEVLSSARSGQHGRSSGVCILRTRGPAVSRASYEPVVRGQSCRVRVRAVAKLGSIVGHGPWSNPVEVRSPEKSQTSLTAPTCLHVQCTTPPDRDPSGSQFSVSWSPAKRKSTASRSSGKLAGYRLYWLHLAQGGVNLTASLNVASEAIGGAESMVTGLGTEHTVGGLKGGTVYSVWVAGLTEAGVEGPSSERIIAWTVPTRPGVPRHIECTSGGHHVLVRWSPPADDGGLGINQYELRAQPAVSASASTLVATDSGEEPDKDGSRIIPVLPPGHCEYCLSAWQVEQRIQLRAVNGCGPGQWSPPINDFLQSPNGVQQDWSATDLISWSDGVTVASPEVSQAEWPRPLRLVEVSQTSVAWSWSPEAVGEYGCQLLTLRQLDVDSSEPSIVREDELDPKQAYVKVDDLTCNTDYVFQVRRTTGDSDPELSLLTEAIRTSPGLPDAPASAPTVEGVPFSEGGNPCRAKLTWQPSATDGGKPVLHYEVAVQREPNGPDDTARQRWTEQSTSTRYTIMSLQLDTPYTFAVRAVSSVGASELSPWSLPYRTGRPLPGAPGQPQLLGPALDYPHLPLLSFAAPEVPEGSSIVTYRCIARSEQDTKWKLEARQVAVHSGVVTAALHGWCPSSPSQTYYLSVQAQNEAGYHGPVSAESDRVYIWQPLPPQQPRIEEVKPGFARLSWPSAPPILDEEGNLIEKYAVHICQLDYRGQERAPRMTRFVKPTFFGEKIIAEVTCRAGDYVAFAVQPAQGAEPRIESLQSQILTIPVGAPERPHQPEILGCKISDGAQTAEVELAWNAPDRDCGACLFGYTIVAYKLSIEDPQNDDVVDMPWVSKDPVRRGAAPAGVQNRKVVTGLEADMTYCFQVRARNSEGLSDASPVSGVVHTPAISPSCCRHLLARANGPTKVLLAWHPPAEVAGRVDKVMHYDVSIAPIGSEAPPDEEYETQRVQMDAPMAWRIRHEVSGLRLSQEYHIRVAAVNQVGRGEEVGLHLRLLAVEYGDQCVPVDAPTVLCDWRAARTAGAA